MNISDQRTLLFGHIQKKSCPVLITINYYTLFARIMQRFTTNFVFINWVCKVFVEKCR